ncbi:MAG: type III pantothenate kinase [Ignavibacteria bacterium]|nr:type III pantothenate kinase [Ignavibacteria bacterium]
MKNLVIDIGNTRIKSAVIVNGKLSKSKSEDYDKTNFIRKLGTLLSFSVQYCSVAISCSNTEHISYIKNRFRKEQNIFLIERNSILPIRIDYAKTLGPDRICGAMGSIKKYPSKKNFLVIDFGTATTYNLVADKIFKGGLITPGVKTALKSLVQNTSLPEPDLKFKKKFYYKNTLDNISNGIILQSLFFTERIIAEYKKEFKNLFVIGTGGNADLIFPLTKLINKKEPDLNLEGLNYFLGFNSK